ncbi:MAG: tetratricopeptide repeat protein [Candidatus Omnitrophica bacterium]|nr:tetratricopeptide repeat protein [Candidatus Omnitrophota bacterium]
MDNIIQKLKPVAPFILLAALVIGVYANSIHGKFLLDDNILIKDNDYIKSFSHVPKVFTTDMGGTSGYVYKFYRPIQMVVHMSQYHLWKFDVRFYHMTSILFHILVVFALYRLINILFKDGILALFTAVLYAVHPIHSESVAAISVIGDPIVALFMLLSLSFYIKQLDEPRPGTYFLLYLTFLLALFSKESGLMLLGLFLAYHFTFRKKIKVLPLMILAAITAFYLLFRIFFFKAAKTAPPDMSLGGIAARIPGIFVAIAGYMRILIAPFGLHMGHEHVLFKMTDPAAITGLAIVIALAAFAFMAWRKNNTLVLFATAWSFITLLPVSNLYPISFYMADHYLYLASIGFFLLVAKALRSAYDKQQLKKYAIAALVILTAFYSVRTMQQNGYWKDARTFYERTLKYTPTSGRSYNNLGNEYLLANDLEKAAEFYRKAIAADPRFMMSYYNLGVVSYKLGKMEDAIWYCQRAIELDPNYPHSYNELGLIYWAMGKKDEAIAAYKTAISLSPNPVTFRNLAMAYSELNMREEAVWALKKALEIDPNAADIHMRLGFIYLTMGRNEDAVLAYSKAISLRPDNVAAMNDLGVIYFQGGMREKGIDLIRKAISIKPDYAAAHANLGLMYLESGRMEEATAAFKRALETDPANKQAQDGLSKIK